MCSYQNMNMVREELCLFDEPVRMILEVHKEHHQLIKDKVIQKKDLIWFDTLDQRGEEESLEREFKQSSCGKKSHSSRSSSKSHRSRTTNSSTKERALAERIQIAELKAEASFIERKHATEYEAEALTIKEQWQKLKQDPRYLR